MFTQRGSHCKRGDFFYLFYFFFTSLKKKKCISDYLSKKVSSNLLAIHVSSSELPIYLLPIHLWSCFSFLSCRHLKIIWLQILCQLPVLQVSSPGMWLVFSRFLFFTFLILMLLDLSIFINLLSNICICTCVCMCSFFEE